jgi:hypothetical protein
MGVESKFCLLESITIQTDKADELTGSDDERNGEPSDKSAELAYLLSLHLVLKEATTFVERVQKFPR